MALIYLDLYSLPKVVNRIHVLSLILKKLKFKLKLSILVSSINAERESTMKQKQDKLVQTSRLMIYFLS